MARSIVLLRKQFIALPLLACLCASVQATPSYRIVFGPKNASPAAIDPAGLVAGQADGEAALWDGTAPQRLGTLGGFSSAALAVSPNGFVTGRADRADGASHAFLYRDGALRDIGQLGVSSDGAGVNAAGQVAGTWVDAAGENHAFLYSGGVASDIGNLGADSARAAGINGAGAVVGSSFLAGFSAYHAFLYQDGVMRDLGTLGGPASAAAAINDAGQVAGTSFIDAEVQHAFLYSEGSMRDIGSLGGAFTEARALNGRGDVVGYSTYADDVPGVDFSSAFLYREGRMFDLNGLVAGPGPWTVLDAVGINDAGQIAAYACTEFGDCRPVRLDPFNPLPEPPPGALLMAGLAALARVRRRAHHACCAPDK